MAVAVAIHKFNQGRDPERLAMKYAKMRANPFTFLCGTCHLFHLRLPVERVLDDAPKVWVCGDLHLENFGSYKGDNRLAYFDIIDFDEAALAPCTLGSGSLADQRPARDGGAAGGVVGHRRLVPSVSGQLCKRARHRQGALGRAGDQRMPRQGIAQCYPVALPPRISRYPHPAQRPAAIDPDRRRQGAAGE
jgi:hypothetical protein